MGILDTLEAKLENKVHLLDTSILDNDNKKYSPSEAIHLSQGAVPGEKVATQLSNTIAKYSGTITYNANSPPQLQPYLTFDVNVSHNVVRLCNASNYEVNGTYICQVHLDVIPPKTAVIGSALVMEPGMISVPCSNYNSGSPIIYLDNTNSQVELPLTQRRRYYVYLFYPGNISTAGSVHISFYVFNTSKPDLLR